MPRSQLHEPAPALMFTNFCATDPSSLRRIRCFSEGVWRKHSKIVYEAKRVREHPCPRTTDALLPAFIPTLLPPTFGAVPQTALYVPPQDDGLPGRTSTSLSALRFVGALPEHFPLCPLTPRPICKVIWRSCGRPEPVHTGSSLIPTSDDDVSNLLDRSTMTLTGVVLQSFQRRWDYERQSCGQWLDALSENWYILDAWGPRGSRADRASSRTRVCRPRASMRSV